MSSSIPPSATPTPRGGRAELSGSEAPAFPRRNGFALVADRDSPVLRSLLRECLEAKAAFSGAAELDWSREWE